MSSNKESTPEQRHEDAVLAISEYISDNLHHMLHEEVQKEISKLLEALTLLNRFGDDILIKQAMIVAKLLLSNNPKLTLAKDINKNLKSRLNARTEILSILYRSNSPVSRVILGLLSLFWIIVLLICLSAIFLHSKNVIFGMPTELLALISFCGMLGGIVSIMVRLQQFTQIKNVDNLTLFLTGFFKPIVGAVFALFLFVALKSEIIPIKINIGKELYFFATLSFIAGFSERAVKDVMSRVEATITQPSQKTDDD
ncbi:MAG: hypothetical protein WAX77_16465 [Methylococcaceae bacterium]